MYETPRIAGAPETNELSRGATRFMLTPGSLQIGELIILGWAAPLWLLWIGTLITVCLAYTSFYFAARSR